MQGFKGRGLEFYSTSHEKSLTIVPLKPVQFSSVQLFTCV